MDIEEEVDALGRQGFGAARKLIDPMLEGVQNRIEILTKG